MSRSPSPVASDSFPEFLQHLPELGETENMQFWVPPRPSIPTWEMYKINTVPLPPNEPADDSREARRAHFNLRTIFEQAELDVEEHNCGVDEANESLLEGYRAELRDWRKKRAAVWQMQLRLLDACIEHIGETIR